MGTVAGSAFGRRLRALAGEPRPPQRAARAGTTWLNVCRDDAVGEGAGRPVAINGLMLAVFRDRGTVFVVANRCPHVGVPLDDGLLIDGCIVCPWHGWRFDLETGEHLTAFGRRAGLRTYEATVSDGVVWIEQQVAGSPDGADDGSRRRARRGSGALRIG